MAELGLSYFSFLPAMF